MRRRNRDSVRFVGGNEEFELLCFNRRAGAAGCAVVCLSMDF